MWAMILNGLPRLGDRMISIKGTSFSQHAKNNGGLTRRLDLSRMWIFQVESKRRIIRGTHWACDKVQQAIENMLFGPATNLYVYILIKPSWSVCRI